MKRRKIYVHTPIKSPTFPLPDLPEDMWCDFRRDYESGSTLKAIAAQYMCDPRTVRRCIMANKSSDELGRQTAPTKLAPYHVMIDCLYAKCTEKNTQEVIGICQISQYITDQLKKCGYTGSERTVRNYLRSKYQYVRQSQPTSDPRK